ncbi:MAG: D-alanyl-D-alanine carboxypeptidase [Geminicoccaceae bacterium]
MGSGMMGCGKRLVWLLLAAVAAVLANPTPGSARQQASIVVDHESGAVLIARSADESVIPASLTKMMTLYLTFRALEAGQIDLSSRLKVSARAAAMPPTKLGLKPGSTIQVEDAILGLVTRSANDAASVLAEALGGSEDRFALAMTRAARKLGMTRTVFRNASGLPNGEQRTTARDLAKLASHLISDYPGYYRYFSSPGFTYRGRSHPNHNRLLGVYPGMDGLKTGYTRASGFNLAASAVRDGRRLVAVVIGGRTAGARDATMVELLDRGFDRARRRDPALVASAEPAPPPVPRPQPSGREIVVASLDTTASDAIVAVPSTRPRALAAKATAGAKTKKVAKKQAAKRSGKGAYAVQVGAFRAPAQARNAMKQALRLAPTALRGTSPSVAAQKVRKQTLYKAMLAGLSRPGAETACRELKKRKQDCMVLRVAPLKVAGS